MSKRIFSFTDPPPEVSYIDPSFFINFLVSSAKFHQQCRDYSAKLKAQQTVLLLSNLGPDEIWFALLKILTIEELRQMGQKNPEGKWFHHLKEHPDVGKKFALKLEEYTSIILQIANLALIEITKDQTLHGLTLIKEYGLLPRDAIHAAAALLSGAGTIITTDYDFAAATNLQVYTCNPKSLKSITPQ